MDTLITYFTEDPLRVLYAVGGSGGLWFWVTLWRGRTRIVVRFLDQKFVDKETPNVEVSFRIEVENLGDSATSIEPQILVAGYDENRNRWEENLVLPDTDRKLEPHSAREFVAKGKVGADYVFWIFRTYTIKLTKGRNRTIRFRTQPSKGELSFFRFDLELTLYRRFGWLPFIKGAA